MKNNHKYLENLPPKGTTDWFPKECAIRKHIFDTFRKVCESFGYEEYLTPMLEKADLYRTKSGEDVGQKELMTFTDLGNRELALRPEMTPSVMRMVTRIYEQKPKPIRLFSIANFFRNEKPQRGRNREFWQLNYDIFGSNSLQADIEVIKIGIEIMLQLNTRNTLQEKPFITYINDRRIITHFLKDVLGINKNITEIMRILDKKDKLKEQEFKKQLEKYDLNSKKIKKINEFMNEDIDIEDIDKYINNLEVLEDIKEVLKTLKEDDRYTNWVKFKPNLIRGLDYYTGIVYEIFDTSKENNRSLFGGGRYDKLGEIFGKPDIPAVGCAPGDEGIRLFLETWDLTDKIKPQLTTYYLPIIDLSSQKHLDRIAQQLRNEDNIVLQGLEKESINKALWAANKKGVDKVILLGSDELEKGEYIQKDLKTGNQIVKKL